MNIRIRELERDGDLAILEKAISVPGAYSFTTPTRAMKDRLRLDSHSGSNLLVNEIARKVDIDSLHQLEEGATSRVTREIKSRFLKNKLNIVIFNLVADQIPESGLIRTLANQLYASSDSSLFLPTVRSAIYKDNNKFSDRKFGAYLRMMNEIMEEIESVGNDKPFIGTIPLIPIKFSRPLINLYHSKGITSFAVDANTSDILLHETDLRAILSEINQTTPLSKTLIYACNLGYPRYEGLSTRADDFLSIFAYVDIMGGTFKVRGFPSTPQFGRPKLKLFSRESYFYKITQSGKYPRAQLEARNQNEQLREAHKVKELLGEQRIKEYIQTKSAVDQTAMGRLESIATRVKVR